MHPDRLTQVETTATFATAPAEDPERPAPSPAPRRKPHWLEDARRGLPAGRFLAYEDSGRHLIVPVTVEVTRIGRSVGAELRFDDTTVSRRHAVLALDPTGVRVLDDRSLNGIHVNGSRVESCLLRDGDEIRVGRHSIWYLDTTAHPADEAYSPAVGAPAVS
ncbi:MAG: FHA domain-containing protein [Solirubrobacterales bacterium]|nr:FHA domain-containing protein [Solirubrobacterales bacterium]